MKTLHRMILRMLPGPFLAWIGTLVFLLLMQFLIRYQKELVGKGLPLEAIVELVLYNLAYIVVLAVPMSVLTAVLIVFGRLADTNAYNAARGAGISLVQFCWPVLVLAGLVVGGMLYFNNIVLPDANFRARNLWQDIRRKQPGFALQPGVFYTGLGGYSILVQATDGPNRLREVTVFDYTEGAERRRVMRAERGEIVPRPGDRVDLVLENGTLDRATPLVGLVDVERYERSTFTRLRFGLDLSQFRFERTEDTDGYRTDRTMPTSEMIKRLREVEAGITREWRRPGLYGFVLPGQTPGVVPLERVQIISDGPPEEAGMPPTAADPLAGLDDGLREKVLDRALVNARSARAGLQSLRHTISYEKRRANRYRVEIHKKFSVAAACFLFALIGIPLGLLFRRGGLASSGALALGIFMFYWVTLVQGEKMSDRGFVDPIIGMWAANVVIGVVGTVLLFGASARMHVRGWLDRLQRPRRGV